MMPNEISEGLATLIAVFLGAGLTIVTTFFTEKQAQKNRAKEQLREHQIDSVKAIVHAMQRLDYIMDSINHLLGTELLQIRSNYTPAQKTNKINNLRQFFLEKISGILEQKEIILQELWELRFLKYHGNEIVLIEQYLERLEESIIRIDLFQTVNIDSFDEKEFICLTSKLHEAFTKYIEGAKNGLSK